LAVVVLAIVFLFGLLAVRQFCAGFRHQDFWTERNFSGGDFWFSKAFFGRQKPDRLVSIFEIKNQLRQQNADTFPVFLQASKRLTVYANVAADGIFRPSKNFGGDILSTCNLFSAAFG
jgi:hypothetical protein